MIQYFIQTVSVLKYILKDTSRFQKFVVNGFLTIRNLSQKFQWCHVYSAASPTDDAPRGVSSFKNDGRWLRGSEYLLLLAWIASRITLHLRQWCRDREQLLFLVSVTANPTSFSQLIEYFSSWEKLWRATTWLLKYRNVLLCTPPKSRSYFFTAYQSSRVASQPHDQNQIPAWWPNSFSRRSCNCWRIPGSSWSITELSRWNDFAE